MSNRIIGNRTKNLLGKWKSHSQSVDISGSVDPVSMGGSSAGLGSDPCMSDSLSHIASGQRPSSLGANSTISEASGGSGADQQAAGAASAKAKWSEHVWSK